MKEVKTEIEEEKTILNMESQHLKIMLDHYLYTSGFWPRYKPVRSAHPPFRCSTRKRGAAHPPPQLSLLNSHLQPLPLNSLSPSTPSPPQLPPPSTSSPLNFLPPQLPPSRLLVSLIITAGAIISVPK